MKIIVHGGLFSESSTSTETKIAKQQSLKRVARMAYDFMKTHSATETVVYAVELLEDDELFNAGIGSQLQNDGIIRMSASIMDGTSLKFSGVINIEEVKNPVRIAEQLLSLDDRVLGGEGAIQYARQLNVPVFSTEIPQRRKEYEANLVSAGTGTVGCVALDANGEIAVATSTGGKGFEIPGRISDSATIAGNFANEFCGVSCTGVGEDIVSIGMATKIVTRVTDGQTIEQAFSKTLAELKTIDGLAGAIGIDKNGTIYHDDSHGNMVFASFDGDKIEVFN